MTIEEMKLAVYQKISANVKKQRNWFFNEIKWNDMGLEVCHEAEKLLDSTQIANYLLELGWQVEQDERFYEAGAFATYKQRLEALCRVWFPERFIVEK